MGAAGGVGKWLAEKALDALLERWRRRRATPLTDAQVRRYHRWHFGVAVATLVYILLLLAIAGSEAIDRGVGTIDAVVLLALTALACYLWRVVRQRWRRI